MPCRGCSALHGVNTNFFFFFFFFGKKKTSTQVTVLYPVVRLGILVLWESLYKRCLDVFKQTTLGDTAIHEVFNPTIFSALLKSNVWKHKDAFA